MKKLLTALLTTAMATSLFACGGSSDSSTEEQPKEPEIVEVIITKDNLEEYFDIYEEPLIVTTMEEVPADADSSFYRPNMYVEEQYRDSQFNNGFMTMIKLKDEYAGQLDYNEINTLILSYSYNESVNKTSGDGTQRIIGDSVTADEWLSVTAPDPYMRQYVKQQFQDAGSIDENGYYAAKINGEVTISDKDLTTGTVIAKEIFYYEQIVLPNGQFGSVNTEMISGGPRFITKIDSLEFEEVKGELHLRK